MYGKKESGRFKYLCHKYNSSKECQRYIIEEDVVLKCMVDALQEKLVDPLLAVAQSDLEAAIATELDAHPVAVAVTEEQLSNASAELGRLERRLKDYPEDMKEIGFRDIREQREKILSLESRMSKHSHKPITSDGIKGRIDAAIERARNLKAIIYSGEYDRAELKQLLSASIATVQADMTRTPSARCPKYCDTNLTGLAIS